MSRHSPYQILCTVNAKSAAMPGKSTYDGRVRIMGRKQIIPQTLLFGPNKTKYRADVFLLFPKTIQMTIHTSGRTQ
jgi:hypothetical protein